MVHNGPPLGYHSLEELTFFIFWQPANGACQMEIGVLAPAGTIEVSIAREEFRHGFFHLSAQEFRGRVGGKQLG